MEPRVLFMVIAAFMSIVSLFMTLQANRIGRIEDNVLAVEKRLSAVEVHAARNEKMILRNRGH